MNVQEWRKALEAVAAGQPVSTNERTRLYWEASEWGTCACGAVLGRASGERMLNAQRATAPDVDRKLRAIGLRFTDSVKDAVAALETSRGVHAAGHATDALDALGAIELLAKEGAT